jgi:hypothetical protein
VLEIKTGVLLGVHINGNEYKLESNGFKKLTLVSNKRMSVPTFEFVFADLTDKINKEITLADGVPIEFHVGRSVDKFDVYKMRVYNYKRDPHQTIPFYTVYGYLDVPKWFLQSWKLAIEDVGSAVIEAVAGECGLEPEVDATNDFMIWLPNRRRACMFAKHIAEHAYLDDSSAFVMGVTLDKKLKLKNLTTLPSSGETFAPGNQPNTANVVDNRYLTGSGYGNSIGGYAHKVWPQLLTMEAEPIEELALTRKTQHLQLNVELKDMLTDNGRLDFGPINAGNVHIFWDQARYQNYRTAMMYGMGVELLIDQRTPFDYDLFTPFNYEAYDPPSTGEAQIADQFRSLYYVTAKAVYITEGNYYEKFQGYSTGNNADPDGKGSQV